MTIETHDVGARRRLMPTSPPAPAVQTPYPGIRRRMFDGVQTTVAEYTFEPGATFPLHRHPQEQIVVVRHGELRLTVAGEERVLAAGQWSLIAGDVDHGITAAAQGAEFLAILAPRRGPGETQVATPE